VHAGLGASVVSCEFLKRSSSEVAALLSDVLARPRFDAEELGRLKRQTLAELVDARDSDAFLNSRALRRHMFEGHPHSRRAAGTLAGVEAIEVDDVRAYHGDGYVRGNAVVAMSGDLSSSEAEQLAEQLLAGLPQGREAEYPVPEPPRSNGRRMVIVDKPERTQCQLAIGTLAGHPKDPDFTALLVANTAFGGSFTSRLTQEVRGKRGWSYGASSHLAVGRRRDGFSMWTAPAADDAPACLALELELLERFIADGITDEELAFCKQYLQRGYAFEVDTARKRAMQKLERRLLDLPSDYHDGFVERVGAVTREQANAAVRERLSADDLWISAVATEAQHGDALREAVAGLAGSTVDAFDLE
jgi:zinc protease